MTRLTRLVGIVLLCSSIVTSGSAAAPDAAQTPGETDADVAEQQSQRRPLRRVAEFAPAGVILDHTHERGEWTFSYRYVRRQRDGLLSGKRTPTAAEIQATGYQVVPRSQQANLHTFGVMYAPRDRLTFAILLPFIERRMEIDRNGARETIYSDGIGDARLVFLVPFIQKGSEKTHINVGISFPTGSIRERDAAGLRLPYSMQLGSGSWDAHWGITYIGRYRWFSWGSQFEGLYRLASNDLGYRKGTIYQASAWFAGSPSKWLSASLRLGWTRTGNVHAADSQLESSKAVNPLNDGLFQGGTRIDIGPGLNLLVPIFGGQHLALEATWPVYQRLDGLQLADQVTFTASWQWVY